MLKENKKTTNAGSSCLTFVVCHYIVDNSFKTEKEKEIVLVWFLLEFKLVQKNGKMPVQPI